MRIIFSERLQVILMWKGMNEWCNNVSIISCTAGFIIEIFSFNLSQKNVAKTLVKKKPFHISHRPYSSFFAQEKKCPLARCPIYHRPLMGDNPRPKSWGFAKKSQFSKGVIGLKHFWPPLLLLVKEEKLDLMVPSTNFVNSSEARVQLLLRLEQQQPWETGNFFHPHKVTTIQQRQ